MSNARIRTPGYPFTPLLFIIAAVVLVINTLKDQLSDNPLRTLLALSIIVLGIPAYFIWRARSKTVYRGAEGSEAD